MATVYSHPAGLGVSAAPNDAVSRIVAFTDGTDPIDVTGWNWTTRRVTVTPVAGEPSKVRLEWDTSRVGSRRWFLTRTNFGRRRLLAGHVDVNYNTAPQPADVEWTLVVTAPDDDIVLQVTGAGGGGGAETLDDLTDVDVPAPDNGDVLTWNNATSSWIAAPAAAVAVPFSDDDPEALGAVAPGTAVEVSRSDHVHPELDVLDGGAP